MKGAIGLTLLMAAGILVVGVLVGFFYVSLVSPARGPGAPVAAATVASQPASGQTAAVTYNPPTIDSAPADIKDVVLYGAHILTDTQILTDSVSATVKCTNCHFNAGVTQGAQNGGISLVGVAATYPKYRDRQKYAVDLIARVND